MPISLSLAMQSDCPSPKEEWTFVPSAIGHTIDMGAMLVCGITDLTLGVSG